MTSSPKPPKPQAGILNRPPDHAVVASYALVTTDAASTAAALERLRGVIARELRSTLDPSSSALDQVPAETGELGFASGYDRYHLTITVGFGAGAYDKLQTDPLKRPRDLRPIPWTQLGDDPEQPENGDICLQICSDSMYIIEHVLRRVSEELSDVFSSLWVLEGHQRHGSRNGRVSRGEGRALTGFLDGTSNLKPSQSADDHQLVFVDPDVARSGTYPPKQPPVGQGQPGVYGGPTPPLFPPDLQDPPTDEPEWCRGGSYQVVRGSVIDTASWDRLSLGEQERRVGRHKASGNALDQPDDSTIEPAEPAFANDPAGMVTALAAHIRKANPRGEGDQQRRIFRRGYPMIRTTTAGMERGLVLVAFARTITTQFEFITRAWTNNPDFPAPGTGPDQLRQLERVLAGGYFFVPALTKPAQPWSWKLPA